MPIPGPRKPLFQPPVIQRGQPGWLQAMAREDLVVGEKQQPKEQDAGDAARPKPGEAGWLTAIAGYRYMQGSGETGMSSGERSSGRSSGQETQGNSWSQGSSGNSQKTAPEDSSKPVTGGKPRTACSQDWQQQSSMEMLASQAVSSQLLAMARSQSQVTDSGVTGAEADSVLPFDTQESCLHSDT